MVLNAKGCNHHVDGFSHGDALLSEKPIIHRALDGQLLAAHIHNWEGQEQFFCGIEVLVALKPLEDFGENDVSHHQWLASQRHVKPISPGCFSAVEVIDPDGRIHQDHLSVRISSRLPDHFSLPRNAFAFDWRLISTSNLRPSSITAFFVFSPDCLRADFIKSSSITTFVRTMPPVCNIYQYYTHLIRVLGSARLTHCAFTVNLLAMQSGPTLTITGRFGAAERSGAA